MTDRSYLDQTGNLVITTARPRRIISLVPSQTGLLSDLGLDEEIVGITKFCIHPRAWLSPKKIIGGTKQYNFDVIHALEPDLIIGNKEENYEEGIVRLRTKYPVWLSDIVSLEDALAMIISLGEITMRKSQAEGIIDAIHIAFSALPEFDHHSVLYLIWRKPWMAAGKKTFIHTMLERTGLRNAIDDERYPELLPEQISALHPDYIFLSSEPYPFEEKHKEELMNLCPAAKIILVDGEMFSWYGSRLIKAPAYFRSLNLR